MKEINKLFEENYGEPLFQPLSEGDKYLPKVLFIPTSNEQYKTNQFIINLEKLTVNALNSKLLLKSPLNSSESRQIYRLGNFLISQFNVSEIKRDQCVNWLFMIQTLRSTSSAHRKGEKFERILKKYELANLINIELCKKVLQDTNNGLKRIIALLKKSLQGDS